MLSLTQQVRETHAALSLSNKRTLFSQEQEEEVLFWDDAFARPTPNFLHCHPSTSFFSKIWGGWGWYRIVPVDAEEQKSESHTRTNSRPPGPCFCLNICNVNVYERCLDWKLTRASPQKPLKDPLPNKQLNRILIIKSGEDEDLMLESLSLSLFQCIFVYTHTKPLASPFDSCSSCSI